MDIFKQKRYLWIVVFLLVFMNLTTLTLLWIGRPPGTGPQSGPPDPAEENIRIQKLLKNELNFDTAQTEQYLQMRQEHHKQSQRLNAEIRKLKQEMFDEVLQDNPKPMLSDSLLILVQEKQANLEQLTFRHFLDLKELCKPEQKHALRLLMHEMFHKNHPPGRNSAGAPPPGPGDKLPPPPIKN